MTATGVRKGPKLSSAHSKSISSPLNFGNVKATEAAIAPELACGHSISSSSFLGLSLCSVHTTSLLHNVRARGGGFMALIWSIRAVRGLVSPHTIMQLKRELDGSHACMQHVLGSVESALVIRIVCAHRPLMHIAPVVPRTTCHSHCAAG